jgi:RHS repeat-associated protein
MITEQNGSAVWQWNNDEAFGDNLPNQDPNGTGNSFVINPRFPGQCYDIETGTHYNFFRDYDPSVGRYVQSDPMGMFADVNTYSYVAARSNMASDKFGLWASKAGFFDVHQFANDDVFDGQDMIDVNSATKYADSDQFQTGQYAYRHAMFDPELDGSRARA